MMRAAVYARISSDPNATALGVSRQVADCTALAEARGWQVAEVFTDNDVSATSGRVRPAYTRMMETLAAGRLDALVCWDVDRLTRTPRELEDVVDLAERRGVALASVGGEIDLATPQGRLTARIKGNVARHEAEQLARRVRRKMAERAESGAPHGRTAYGWRREQVYDSQGRRLGSRDVLHPEQAEVIRSAAAAVLAGESLRSVVARLNAAGEVTLNGKPWTTTTLRLILLRERNAGMRVHRGQVVGRGDWEPVHDEDTHRRLVAALTNPVRRSSPGNAVRYVLSGLARCGVCGGPMRVLVAGKGGRKAATYVCQDGYHVRRQMEPLDEFVTRLVVGRLARPDAADLLGVADDEEARQARQKAEALRARLDLAADSYAEGEIDGQQLARITKKLRPELERWEQAARAASTSPDLLDLATPDIAQRWESLPLARRRAVIDVLLIIRVLPSTARGGAAARFDPESVRVDWRAA
jgi:site-specific DNA recombinase